jgi:hypothetical protein
MSTLELQTQLGRTGTDTRGRDMATHQLTQAHEIKAKNTVFLLFLPCILSNQSIL